MSDEEMVACAIDKEMSEVAEAVELVAHDGDQGCRVSRDEREGVDLRLAARLLVVTTWSASFAISLERSAL